MSKLLPFLVCCLSFIACPIARGDTATLLDQMTDSGIVVTEGQSVVLAKPSLQPGQDNAERKKVLETLAGGRGWRSFSRKSISAPVAIKVQYVKNEAGDRIGHDVHSVFVVYASLETLENKDLMEQLFINEADSEDAEGIEAEELTPAELKAAGIDSVPDNETFGLVRLPLLKRVIVRGVTRTQRLSEDDSVTLVWEIDPRFTGDASQRNTWATLQQDDSGETSEGEKLPYRGAGGYMSITRLTELENACLVESRFVMHEPKEWFRGTNVLRSKLPILLQESAKRFRRKLMER